MKKLLLTLTMCFSIMMSFAQTTTFSLQDAVAYAVENDRRVQLAEWDILDAAAQTKELLASGLPQLNASVGYNFFAVLPTSLIPADFFGGAPGTFQEVQFGTKNNLTGTLSASWLAFDGSYTVAKEGSVLYKDLTELQVLQIKRQIEESVTQAYINTLIYDFTKTTLDNNIENLKKLLFETKETYTAGFAEQLDVDRLQLTLQTLENELESFKGQEKILKDALKYAMSYPLENEVEIGDNIDLLLANEFTSKMTEQLDINNRPEMAVLDKSIELTDVDIRRNEKAYLPTVSLFANYEQAVTGNELDNLFTFPTVVMGFQVTAPIFDGFATRSRIERAQVAKEKAIVQKEDVERGLKFQVEMARTNFKNTYDRLQRIKSNLTLAEKIHQTVKIKFKEGVGTSFEVIQAEGDLYSAQSSYAQALYDYLKAKADFELALGK